MWIQATAGISTDFVPTWIEAIATSAGVIVAILAIIFAYKQLRLTAHQLRDTARRESQNSEDQTRPYIGLDVCPGIAGAPTFDLVIANFGRTSARSVRLALNGGFSPQSDEDELAPALERLFSSPFDLAPGSRRRVFWRMPKQDNAKPQGPIGASEEGVIALSYEWQPGAGEERRLYEETFSYNLIEYPKVVPSPFTGATAQGVSDNSNVHMRNAVNALRAIAHNVGESNR